MLVCWPLTTGPTKPPRSCAAAPPFADPMTTPEGRSGANVTQSPMSSTPEPRLRGGVTAPPALEMVQSSPGGLAPPIANGAIQRLYGRLRGNTRKMTSWCWAGSRRKRTRQSPTRRRSSSLPASLRTSARGSSVASRSIASTTRGRTLWSRRSRSLSARRVILTVPWPPAHRRPYLRLTSSSGIGATPAASSSRAS